MRVFEFCARSLWTFNRLDLCRWLHWPSLRLVDRGKVSFGSVIRVTTEVTSDTHSGDSTRVNLFQMKLSFWIAGEGLIASKAVKSVVKTMVGIWSMTRSPNLDRGKWRLDTGMEVLRIYNQRRWGGSPPCYASLHVQFSNRRCSAEEHAYSREYPSFRK